MPRTKAKTGEGLDIQMLGRAARALRVMAHPVRLKMIELLMSRPISVGDLAEIVDQPPAAVSQHLNIMRAHGIVEARREGRQVYYEVISPQAEFMIDCLRRHSKVL